MKVDKVSIMVFTENDKQRKLYFNLFKFILKDKIIQAVNNSHEKRFETDKFLFKFYNKAKSTRGHKAHYVLNLTQDEEFHCCIAEPMTVIRSYLKDDSDWIELFEGIEE